MPAVGDIRNRLMALADRSVQGNPGIFRPSRATVSTAEARSGNSGRSWMPCVREATRWLPECPSPCAKLPVVFLGFFRGQMPDDFDSRGASVGNLILTGGYFNHDRQIEPALYLFSRLVEARGTVRPVINDDLHLVAELEDGTILRGQHMITGKEVETIRSPVRKVWLTADLDELVPAEAPVSDNMRELIASADLICYPMGSFYTSVMANLLPMGVGAAVAEARCPKIYIPSLGDDPEALGLGLFESTRRLLQALETSASQNTPASRLLNFVLLDTANGTYPEPMELEKLSRLGVRVIDAALISEKSAPLLDESLLIRHLLSLV